ncbi:MAG: hypothetical protein AAB387_02470, partial [candidate division NC10 bacterium]
MVDRERVLARLDDLDGFLRELRSIAPRSLDEYLKTEKKRACERLVQVSVEALIDVCALLVSGPQHLRCQREIGERLGGE